MEGPSMAASAFYIGSHQQQQQHFTRDPEEGTQLRETSSNNGQVVTLLVRHLPEAIPHDTLSRLFSHYGASSVRPCAAGRLRNCVFVDFENEVLASQAQSQLNRLRFLGKVLSVERAGMATSNKKQKTDGQLVRESTSAPAALSIDSPVTGNHTKGGAVPGAVSIGEPIASKIGVDYPFPAKLDRKVVDSGGENAVNSHSDEWWMNFGIDDPALQNLAIRILSQTCSSSGCERNWSVFERIHTKRRNRLEHKRLNDLVYTHYNLRLKERYAYPPPDGNILTNIVNALIAVPRFYTQVLHLMNKMNLPAPFRAALPTPPLPPSVPAPPPPPPPPPPIVAKPHLADLSSDESELESSDEGDPDDKSCPVEIPRKGLHAHKRAKREAIVGPAVDKSVPHEAVGLKSAILVPKEFPTIKKKTPVLQIKIAPKPVQNEVMHGENTAEEVTELSEMGLDVKPYATPQEIEAAKLPPEEILSLPMFKNYTAGNPTTVLYIKNLAKDVVVDDFYFIFGSLFDSLEAVKSGINVKLMQDGRMRGQAFLTFPSIELAKLALNLVNGFVFKGKAMIIQFGRNPAAGKAN